MKAMKKVVTTKILLVCTTLSLTGCGIFETPPVKYLPNDNSMIALNHIADKAQHSTAVLAEIQAKNPPKNYTNYSHRRYRKYPQSDNSQGSVNKTKGSEQKISFIFTGPLNEAIQQLSTKAGYDFMIGGNSLKGFPAVSVNENNTSLSTIVTHINQQLPNNIRVVCYSKTKSMLVIIQPTGA